MFEQRKFSSENLAQDAFSRILRSEQVTNVKINLLLTNANKTHLVFRR
ncbi:hypothetical protein SAMN04515617_12919 [Collimonas sp. OK242]|nr:hypothetical protein SAMN04515617_12919 [Collimonas sp. OK242]